MDEKLCLHNLFKKKNTICHCSRWLSSSFILFSNKNFLPGKLELHRNFVQLFFYMNFIKIEMTCRLFYSNKKKIGISVSVAGENISMTAKYLLERLIYFILLNWLKRRPVFFAFFQPGWYLFKKNHKQPFITPQLWSNSFRFMFLSKNNKLIANYAISNKALDYVISFYMFA